LVTFKNLIFGLKNIKVAIFQSKPKAAKEAMSGKVRENLHGRSAPAAESDVKRTNLHYTHTEQ